MILGIVIAVLAGYLLGAVPSGLLIGKFWKGIDIRKHGSGKTGATNVLRTLGPGAAAVAVLLDILKGVVAILIARIIIAAFIDPRTAAEPLSPIYIGEFLTAVATIFGHTQSVWAKLLTGSWTGGRAVLTGAGCMLPITPLAVILGILLGVAIIAITRYASLGSIIGVATAGVLAVVGAVLGMNAAVSAFTVCFCAAIVIALHKDNIQRLLAGTERKLGQSRSA